MSIASEMTNLAANRDAIKAAIEAKNPSVAPTNALSSFPASIASIPSGGSGDGAWSKPDDWPDIRAILEADPHQHTNKLIALIDANSSKDTIALAGGSYYVLSDGYEASGGNHDWDTTKDIAGSDGRRYRWGIVMSDSALTQICPCSGGSYDTKILWSYGPDASISYSVSYPNYKMRFCQQVVVGSVTQTRGNRPFSDMDSLVELKADSIKVVSMQQAFQGDYNLRNIDVETFDTKGVSNMSNAFSNCTCLTSIPTIDTSSATTMGSMFNGCRALTRLPSSFYVPDGCVVDRLYQDCVNLHIPAPRLVAGSSGTGVIFYNAYSLESMGDYVDLRSITSYSSIFNSNSFVKVPTTLLLSKSLDISSAYYKPAYKDRFAEFDGGGSLIGGLVYNINTVSGLTLTVGSVMRGFFSASEVSAIEAAMAAKGWTIAW